METQSAVSAVSAPVMCSELTQKSMDLMEFMEKCMFYLFSFPCDRETGKCNCLPNVIGDYCSECKENHWKIASGEGCDACACDPTGNNFLGFYKENILLMQSSGSYGESCNLYTGQCDCKPGFGGRQCNQCEVN